ncbi:MAG: hypothetical protein JWP12_1443 [Bacteroidetes bacterium]|nr:hypothetical protein [Bacteroidota bacterium]
MLFCKNYSISVPEPCHEKWENMHAAAGGRFCDSCEENVVDFTGMNEKEIILYFRNKKHTGCGRFEVSQVGKNYVVNPQIKLQLHQRFFSYLFTFFVSNAIVDKVAAQTDTTTIVQPDTIAQLAGNDSALLAKDSLMIAQADTTGCVEDSASIAMELKAEFPETLSVSEPYIVTVTTVSGGFYWDPPANPDPTFLDFFKVKFRDSLAVLKKTVGIIKEEQIPTNPETPEKPAKKDTTIVSAVLPDELKRKGDKRA